MTKDIIFYRCAVTFLSQLTYAIFVLAHDKTGVNKTNLFYCMYNASVFMWLSGRALR